MKDSKRLFARLAVPALFAAALAIHSPAQSASSDEDVANGLDPVTTGRAIGNYPGGTLLAGEYFPTLAKYAAATTDEEIANGLDPITTGQVIGNFQGGKVLLGEYLPHAESVLTAERKR